LTDVVYLVSVVWLAVLVAIGVVLVVRAGTAFDRILALDTTILVLVGFLLVLSVRQDEATYADGALILALLSFVATVALARYGSDRRPFG
jgi:multisubunit Na+/H+ antiporter MnhF subunit